MAMVLIGTESSAPAVGRQALTAPSGAREVPDRIGRVGWAVGALGVAAFLLSMVLIGYRIVGWMMDVVVRRLLPLPARELCWRATDAESGDGD